MADKSMQHDILQIFIKIFDQLGYIPTRDEFIVHSKLTQKCIVKVFGSYTDLVNASGLAPKRIKKTYGERQYDSEKIKFTQVENVHDKFTVEIKPYYNKFDYLNRKNLSIGVCISDSHSQFWDEFTWQVFFAFIKDAQPELIVLGGDNLEFYRISKHQKDPTRAMNLQSEIDFVVENKLKKIRELCPRSQIDYHIGNHEARLFSYLCTDAPALSSLRCLKFNELLDLDKYEINFVSRENFIFNPKKDKDNYKVYENKWAWTHGTDCGNFPADKELNHYGLSGASGHVHRHTYKSKRNLTGYLTWQSLGASCTLKTGKEYIQTMINWDNGFGIVYFHKNGVTQEHITTSNGFAALHGKVFYAKD